MSNLKENAPCSSPISAARIACFMMARSVGSGLVVGGVGIVLVFGVSMVEYRELADAVCLEDVDHNLTRARASRAM